MKLIEGEIMASVLGEMKENQLDPRIKTGLGMAQAVVSNVRAIDALSLPEVKEAIREAYKKGYIDGSVQQNALGIK